MKRPGSESSREQTGQGPWPIRSGERICPRATNVYKSTTATMCITYCHLSNTAAQVVYIHQLHLSDGQTVVSARSYHHHLHPSLHLVEVGAVSVILYRRCHTLYVPLQCKKNVRKRCSLRAAFVKHGPRVKCGCADLRMFKVVKCGCRCGYNPHFTHTHAISAHPQVTVTVYNVCCTTHLAHVPQHRRF